MAKRSKDGDQVERSERGEQAKSGEVEIFEPKRVERMAAFLEAAERIDEWKSIGRRIKQNGNNYKPTVRDRALVATASSTGFPQQQIADALEISPNTLRDHFVRELELGGMMAVMTAVEVIFDHVREGDLDAAKFVVSRRAREIWSDKAGQAPVTVNVNADSPSERVNRDPDDVARVIDAISVRVAERIGLKKD